MGPIVLPLPISARNVSKTTSGCSARLASARPATNSTSRTSTSRSSAKRAIRMMTTVAARTIDVRSPPVDPRAGLSLRYAIRLVLVEQLPSHLVGLELEARLLVRDPVALGRPRGRHGLREQVDVAHDVR